MHLHILLALVAMAALTASAKRKSHCERLCGNVTIPYPFGTSEGCYSHPNFTVTCNHTSDTSTLYLGESNIVISNILPSTSEMEIMKRIATDCYNRSGSADWNNTHLWLEDWAEGELNIWVSTKNRFVAIGCDTYAYFLGTREDVSDGTGCISRCGSQKHLKNGSCSGVGCCQVAMPEGMTSFQIILESYNNHKSIIDFNPCSYGFFIKEGTFKFSTNYLLKFEFERTPMLLEWAIGDSTCRKAEKKGNFLCKGNSTCDKTYRGRGYRCICLEGYQGNPYDKHDGCKDIDECASSNHGCVDNKTCRNTLGGYMCKCDQGYTGDGFKNGTRCTDIDECATGNHGCVNIDNTCNNTLGSYNCTCPHGYSGDGWKNGTGCKNIDECALGNHGCVHKCIDKQGTYTCQCRSGYSGDGKKDGSGCTADMVLEIAVGSSAAAIFLIVFVNWLYFCLKNHKLMMLREKFFKQNGGIMLQQQISRNRSSHDQAKVFTTEELKVATNNYHESRIIGKGGFGTVYKGTLSDNRTVAIKKSKLADHDQIQIEQFINEVVILSQINHRNVVKMIGCCLETEVPLLVYEFIPNGTLSDHIHNKGKSSAITWDIRLKIATGTAEALSYLHSAASVPIIHRDVKPMNILLDDNYVAKVADFGASRLIPTDQIELATIVQGTLGYLDPEYLQTNQLTDKSDVYSFGVVLVELLTGKKVLSFDRPEEDRNLSMLFLSSLKQGRLFQILDEHLQQNEDRNEIISVSRIAERCLHVKGDERPTMKEVAMELEGICASRIQKHPWVQATFNEEEGEYLLKEKIIDIESTDGANASSSTFDSMSQHTSLPIASGR